MHCPHPQPPTFPSFFYSSLFIRIQLWSLTPANTPFAESFCHNQLESRRPLDTLWRPLWQALQSACPSPESLYSVPSLWDIGSSCCISSIQASRRSLRNLLTFPVTSRWAKSQEHGHASWTVCSILEKGRAKPLKGSLSKSIGVIRLRLGMVVHTFGLSI